MLFPKHPLDFFQNHVVGRVPRDHVFCGEICPQSHAPYLTTHSFRIGKEVSMKCILLVQ